MTWARLHPQAHIFPSLSGWTDTGAITGERLTSRVTVPRAREGAQRTAWPQTSTRTGTSPATSFLAYSPGKRSLPSGRSLGGRGANAPSSVRSPALAGLPSSASIPNWPARSPRVVPAGAASTSSAKAAASYQEGCVRRPGGRAGARDREQREIGVVVAARQRGPEGD